MMNTPLWASRSIQFEGRFLRTRSKGHYHYWSIRGIKLNGIHKRITSSTQNRSGNCGWLNHRVDHSRWCCSLINNNNLRYVTNTTLLNILGIDRTSITSIMGKSPFIFPTLTRNTRSRGGRWINHNKFLLEPTNHERIIINLVVWILAMITSIQEPNKLHSLMEDFITNININKFNKISSKV